ncbi:MAG: hypothetical protein ACLPKB_02230 [Xanthobacteraceae bacterium]
MFIVSLNGDRAAHWEYRDARAAPATTLKPFRAVHKSLSPDQRRILEPPPSGTL